MSDNSGLEKGQKTQIIMAKSRPPASVFCRPALLPTNNFEWRTYEILGFTAMSGSVDCCFTASIANGATVPAGFADSVVAGGLTNPTAMASTSTTYPPATAGGTDPAQVRSELLRNLSWLISFYAHRSRVARSSLELDTNGAGANGKIVG